jgi:LPPG:FO 2-phospho-L-lactate transferase
MIAVLCGGVGAARFLGGLVQVTPPESIVAIVNTGDDLELAGLSISPDLDTVTYTLAGAIDPGRGWGLVEESFAALGAFARYGLPTWFGVGDKDLATHLYRTSRLAAGATLSDVAAEIARAWGLGLRIVPMSDDRVRTRVTLAAGGEISFQEYFVERHHDVAVSSVSFEGADGASPAPGVLEALREADTIVIAPSNPFVSIGPILAIAGVADVLSERRDRVVAISPIVAGKALKGPADRLLVELGHEPSALGVARHLTSVTGSFVIDRLDAGLESEIASLGLNVVVTDTVMRTPAVAAALAQHVLDAGRSRSDVNS